MLKGSGESIFKRFLVVLIVLSALQVNGQDSISTKESKKSIFKDTLDGKFDFSRFLIDYKGFIPVPMIITEPALGDFGMLMAFAFITRQEAPPGVKYVAPDITAAAAMYTANGSWLVGGGRIGSFPKLGIKYRAFGGYIDMNLDFYRDIAQKGEQKFAFNIDAFPVMLNLSKELGKSNVYLGLQYLFANTKVKPKFEDNLPDVFPEKDMKSVNSSVGIFMDIDKRDNFFTASKGFRVNTLFSVDDNWTGSDYEYSKLTGFLHWFFPIQKKWTSGIRLDAQQVFNEPPFYFLPYVNMRGIPVARYQGYTTALIETEQRYDLNLRWSAVGFGGLGKAIGKNQSFGDADLVYSVGGGFRYLMARAFGLRGGIDVAAGPGNVGWYIVFGHSWNK